MRILINIGIILLSLSGYSQNKVDLLNKGNDYYENKDFESAIYYYKRSIEKDPLYYKANLNAGHASFRNAIQKNDSSSLNILHDADMFYRNAIKTSQTSEEKSESYYNLGNAQLIQQKLEESIESYKSSLRLEPENMNAKHNLALAQYLLNKQEQ